MKRNGLATPYLIFVRGMMFLGRHTTSGRAGTRRKESKAYQTRRPHNIKYKNVMPKVEETIIDLRLTKRYGCSRIKFRLRRIIGLSLSTRTIYKTLKRYGLNILKCNANTRTYRRFAMRHSNDMVQMDILGPFYLHNSERKELLHKLFR